MTGLGRICANSPLSRSSGATAPPFLPMSSSASRASNSAVLSSPISSRRMGVSSGADRDSHALIVLENEAGSMPSRSSQAAIESRTGVVSTPPKSNTATPTEAVWSRDIGPPANRGPVGEPLQPVRDRVEGEPLAHQGLNHSVCGELGQLVVADAHQSRVLRRVEAPVQADDRVVLDQGVVERSRLDLPSREADQQDPALA